MHTHNLHILVFGLVGAFALAFGPVLIVWVFTVARSRFPRRLPVKKTPPRKVNRPIQNKLELLYFEKPPAGESNIILCIYRNVQSRRFFIWAVVDKDSSSIEQKYASDYWVVRRMPSTSDGQDLKFAWDEYFSLIGRKGDCPVYSGPASTYETLPDAHAAMMDFFPDAQPWETHMNK